MSEPTPEPPILEPPPPPLLLHQMLAAPVSALVRAQTISAMALLDVISTVGFEAPQSPPPSTGATGINVGNLRMVAFSYQRQTPDGSSVPMSMQLPVLSLIPLPVFQATQSTFAFDVALTGVRSPTQAPTGPGATANLPEIELAVALPPAAQGGQGATTAGPMMNVQMTVQSGDLPGGVLNLLQLINTGAIVTGGAPTGSQ